MIQSQTSGTNAANSVVITAVDGQYVNIRHIHCGYSAAPTNGVLSIVEDGVTLFSAFVGAGTTDLAFDTLRVGAKDFTITLSAGGTGITSKLNLDISYSARY